MLKKLVQTTSLTLGLLAGCFDPELASVRLLCDGVSRFCPANFSCINGVCTNSGSVTPPGGSLDGGGSFDGGGGSLDGGAVDLARPLVHGCKNPYSNGTDVSNVNGDLGAGQAFTCPGTFSGGSDPTVNAASLCATGYHVCDYGETLTKYSLGRSPCAFVRSYFFVNVYGGLPTTTKLAYCSAALAGDTPGFASCGRISGTPGDAVFSAACNGMSFFLSSNSNNGGFSTHPTKPTDLFFATNTNPTYGVVCCKNW